MYPFCFSDSKSSIVTECNFCCYLLVLFFLFLISRFTDGVICDAFNYCSHDKSSITRQMFPAERWHQNQDRDKKLWRTLSQHFPNRSLILYCAQTMLCAHVQRNSDTKRSAHIHEFTQRWNVWLTAVCRAVQRVRGPDSLYKHDDPVMFSLIFHLIKAEASH